MNRTRLAARRLALIARKTQRAIAVNFLDLLAFGGIVSLALGAQFLSPGLLVFGGGLIWAVRFGRPERR